MQISVQKSFLIEFCHWRRGWLYEVDVEDAISLEVNPVDRPEGEDFDSSAASCWPGNVRVMTAVFEPSSDFIEVDHAGPHSESPAPPDSRNWGICLGPVVSDGATTNTMPIPEQAPIPIPFYVIMAAQRGAFLEQHFTPSVALASSAGHLIMFHTDGCGDFPFRIRSPWQYGQTAAPPALVHLPLLTPECTIVGGPDAAICRPSPALTRGDSTTQGRK